MVGDGSRCFMGYNFYPFVYNGSTLTHSGCAVAGVLLSGVKLCSLFYFYGGRKGSEGKTMTIINLTTGRQGTRTTAQETQAMSDADIVRMFEEYDLMLEEIENLLQEELLAIHLMRKRSDREPRLIFETAVRLLERKKNRSIKQEAILAYARKKLEEEAQKVQKAKCKL
jgi:hypothetical protein